MPEKLKDLFFTDDFVTELGEAIALQYPAFDRPRFQALVQDDSWPDLELKAKMHHIVLALGQTLPDDFPAALSILRQVAPGFGGFRSMVFPDYCATYGLEHFDLSMEALGEFTSLCSSEYGVRPFIAQDPSRAMEYLMRWAEDESEHLRRLASEGCRPKVPWGMVLQCFRKDPQPILPILELLRDDASQYVRTSVANNLNDISKDHPDLVLEVAERWHGHSDERDALVKHACRGLLKKGSPRAMALFGFRRPRDLAVENLSVEPTTLGIGGEAQYVFDLVVAGDDPQQVRLELGVDYVKARGGLSRKVFQIREGTFPPGRHRVARRAFFADHSTRRHYPGRHRLTIVVNGVEKATADVHLTLPASTLPT